MDLPRLGEAISPEPLAYDGFGPGETGANDAPFDETYDSAQPVSHQPPAHQRPMAEPLPAWLRGDQDLLGEDDFSDLDADREGEPPIGLRGLRWIRKNMSSFKVTVSLQRPLPPAQGKSRKTS